MTSNWTFLSVLALVAPWTTSLALAQTTAPPAPNTFTRIYRYHSTTHQSAREESDSVNAAAAPAFIPIWNYSIVAPKDGQTYSGSMVGRDPSAHGHRTTIIPAYVVAVKLTMPDGTVFDPTVKRTCATDSVINLVKNSPVFQTSPFTMNGVSIGTTQYNDAFQRSNFWSYVQNTPYHLTLAFNQLPEMSMTIPAGKGTSAAGNNGCGKWAQVDSATFESLLTNLVNALPANVDHTTEPIFLFDSIGLYENGDVTQCCVGGEHYGNATTTNSGVITDLQTYIWSAYDTAEVFNGDIADITHEVGEWTNDPIGGNPTPNWGNIGQVQGCQNNLEVGDPLSSTNYPGIAMNGTTYHPQELAYFSWFFDQPSIGAGAKYSDNGTFTGGSAACQ